MNVKKQGRRFRIRLGAFVTATVITLAVWGITQTVKNKNYELRLSIEQQRTVSALATYLDSVTTDLKKMQYVNTPAMASKLAISVERAAAGAKNCLSELSAGSTQLFNINKFLSQSGDYIGSINERMARGEKLGDKDREQLRKLYDYSASLSSTVSYIEDVMYSGNIRFEDTVSTLAAIKDTDDPALSYLDTISDAEEAFADYPTLIYDGPFSDNIPEKKSEFLKNKKEISRAEAKKTASKISGIDENRLTDMEDDNSVLASYVFYYNGTTVAITKKGGYLSYMLSDKYAGEEKISREDAVKKASAFLRSIGYGSMKESYYFDSDGICTVNFAYTENDIVCYPDLIKVSVSLSDGKITSADAKTYLMDHKTNRSVTPEITPETAKNAVSPELKTKRSRMTVIPTSNGKETAAYEFLCTDIDENDVLVYVDAKTGSEAQIMLLLYSDGGTLTM